MPNISVQKLIEQDLVLPVLEVNEEPPNRVIPLGMYALVWPSGGSWSAQDAHGRTYIPILFTDGEDSSVLMAKLKQSDKILLLDGSNKPLGMLNTAAYSAYLLQEKEHLEAVMTTLLHTVSEAVTVIDSNNIVTYWNEQAESQYRIKSEEIVGRDINDFFSNLLITQVQNNTLAEARDIRDRYHQPVLGSHVLSNASPVLYQNHVIGAVVAEREITETMRLSNELARSNLKVNSLKSEITKISRSSDAFYKIYGRSDALKSVIDMAKRVSRTNVSILLHGESGTGKALLAEAIHLESERSDNAFVVVNCGAVPDYIFEGELFGISGEGSIAHPGKLGEAYGGTLFFDEISKLSLDMQTKILRVLQEHHYHSVGSNQLVDCDVRLISASECDLEQLVKEGRFLEELYFRINVVCLDIPPLRDRKEDISQLVYLFVREFCLNQGVPVKHIDPEVINYMLNYSWPGNILELRNIAERMVALSDDNNITTAYLPSLLKYKDYSGNEDFGGGLSDITDKTERDLIIQALDKSNGDRSKAAKLLGIPRSTLYYKLKKYQIGNKNF